MRPLRLKKRLSGADSQNSPQPVEVYIYYNSMLPSRAKPLTRAKG